MEQKPLWSFGSLRVLLMTLVVQWNTVDVLEPLMTSIEVLPGRLLRVFGVLRDIMGQNGLPCQKM